MSTIREIKEQYDFDTDLRDLLEMMKSIAVTRFRALQMRKERFAEFVHAVEGFFRLVDLSKVNHPYVNPVTDKTGIVMITSNEGFMGGLNYQIINRSILHEEAHKFEIMIVGERGAQYVKEMGREFTLFRWTEVGHIYKLAAELKEFIVKGIRQSRFGRVVVAYPSPVSFMVQKVEIVTLLPVAKMIEYDLEERERGSVIIESSFESMAEYLLELLMLQRLTDILEDSKLSEYAARAIHLENSSQELTEQLKHLKFRYFSAHHGVINKNIREIYSAQIIRRKR